MKTITVKELGRVVTGHTPPTSKREYYGDSYPFVKPTDMCIGSKYTYETEEGYSDLAVKKYKNSMIPKGSTCVVCIGTLGEKMTMAHCDLFTNQSVNSIIPNDDYDQNYVFYLLKYNLNKVKALNKGTASGREFVSKSTFLDLEIEVFEDINIQRKIGKILSTYDDLIENCRRQLKLLEEMALRFYREWFVKLNYPGSGKGNIIDGIPEGWKMISVNDCLSSHMNGGWGKEQPTGKNVHPGKVIRGTDINDIKGGIFYDVPLRYHNDNDIEKRTLNVGDIVFELSNGNIKNIGRCLLIDEMILRNTGENTICASFCKMFRPVDKKHGLLLYWEIQEMQASGRMLPFKKQGSNGINNFAFEEFLDHKFLFPKSDELIAVFEDIMTKMGNTQQMLATLLEARDRLLAQLISGTIEPKF